MKICSDCKESKQISEFNKNKSLKDGHEHICRECKKIRAAKYKARPEVKAKAREYELRYRKKNADKIKSRNKELWSNPEYREKQKQYKIENKEKFKEYNRKYVAKSLPKRTVSKHLWLASMEGLESNWSEDEYNDMMNNFSGKCAISGSSDNIEVDHFIARSTGKSGTHKGNMLPVSAKINQSKANKNPYEWIKNRSEEEKARFSIVISYLAGLNNMTEDEYRDFVYECYSN